MLFPGQSFYDATTGTRDPAKKIEKYHYTINSEHRHKGEGNPETQQSCAFEEDEDADQYLATRYDPHQEGGPGVG